MIFFSGTEQLMCEASQPIQVLAGRPIESYDASGNPRFARNFRVVEIDERGKVKRYLRAP